MNEFYDFFEENAGFLNFVDCVNCCVGTILWDILFWCNLGFYQHLTPNGVFRRN